ncbi:MAG: 30S ribosomal protein S20 [Clostridia bacterium]|nr:30S ribosomal protein S20 [Clostridia bacterium]
MPIIKSAKKRQEVAIRNNERNKARRSALATAIKKFNKAISEKDVELAEKLLPETFSIIDAEVTRNIIHKNKANNKKADLSIALTKLKAEKSEAK